MPKFLRNLAAAVLASGFACNPSCWAQQASNKELPLVWVLSTGGTIAGTGASSTVTKTNTYRVETFRSPDLGYLGYVDEDKVSFYRASTKRHTVNSEFDVSNITEFPKVDILYSYVEPNVATIGALLGNGVKGIVFAGTGAGGLSDLERDAMKAILSSPSGAKPVIVRSNRTGTGRVIARKEYDELGYVAADTLNPQKSRILLMLALTRTDDVNEIRRMFSEY
jgi:L-asparaginase